MGADRSAYHPFQTIGRPGGKPDYKPRYRVVVRRRYAAAWLALVSEVGQASAQQFYDHVARTPGRKPDINSATVLKGKRYAPYDGYSAVIHYRISGVGRVDYRYHDAFTGGARGDAHRVVFILFVGRSSAGT